MSESLKEQYERESGVQWLPWQMTSEDWQKRVDWLEAKIESLVKPVVSGSHAKRINVLQPPRFLSVCTKCSQIIVFEPGRTIVECPKCETINTIPVSGCESGKLPKCMENRT